jgi:RNA polymerase sigma-70 factor
MTSSPYPRWTILRQALEGPVDEAQAAVIEQKWDQALERARQEWPGVDVSESSFVAYVATRLRRGPDIEAALSLMNVPDLYICCACVSRVPGAAEALERRYFGEIASALRKVQGSRLMLEEVTQSVRESLFLPREGRDPQLSAYQGVGPLRRWVRIIALRAGFKALRSEQRLDETEPDEVERLSGPLAESDIELLHLRALYTREVKGALEDAIRSLKPDERELLRRYYFQDLGVVQLGELLGVHHTSISYRLGKARSKVLSATRRALMAKLNIGRAELDSLIRAIRSQVDVSGSVWG